MAEHTVENDPVVDPTALVRLEALGGETLLREMARLYLENAELRVAQIGRGLAAGGELSDAEAGAHSLKSSAANLGATRVARLANGIERAVQEGEVGVAAELYPALVRAAAGAAAELGRRVNPTAGETP
ncbi:MAG: Hpt domain-containing protein [Longimicrobiales bacterium]|nr:Hpt domain-containing protein [Longimicrobiales bacterium]